MWRSFAGAGVLTQAAATGNGQDLDGRGVWTDSSERMPLAHLPAAAAAPLYSPPAQHAPAAAGILIVTWSMWISAKCLFPPRSVDGTPHRHACTVPHA